jgi:3',5'-cyclic AMP phosphodiesterase CpdA
MEIKTEARNRITQNLDTDGIDRRGFLKCMAWAGTGALLAVSGGILRSQTLSRSGDLSTSITPGELSFVQISDSHVGFSKEANKDVLSTLKAAIDKINALPTPPAFVLHTGDLTHLSKPEEFDALDQLLKSAKTERIFYVPGEHDVLTDNGAIYLQRYGRGTKGSGWQSFDVKGVHFIGLVNVLNLKAGGLGNLGREQLEWLEKDLKNLSSSTPVVVFAHIPLWAVYPQWGWGTRDSAQALSHLRRFGSVTVLNGHIHQTMQKVEGNITFHTATSTAFPQPQPGAAPAPGPMKVPSEQLRGFLGLTSVHYQEHDHTLAITDTPLLKTGEPISQ